MAVDFATNRKLFYYLDEGDDADTARDSESGGHHLTQTSDPASISPSDLPTLLQTPRNLAREFTGSGYFSLATPPSDARNPTGDFAVCFTMRADVSTTRGVLGVYDTGGNDREWGFFIFSGVLYWAVSTDGSSTVNCTYTLPAVGTDEVYRVYAEYEHGVGTKLYVNGTERDSDTGITGDVHSGSASFSIGRLPDLSRFDGWLRNVGIWHGLWNADTIAAHAADADAGPGTTSEFGGDFTIDTGEEYDTLALLEADIDDPDDHVYARAGDGFNAAPGAVTVSFANANSKFLILAGLPGELPRDKSGWATNQRSAAEACGYFGSHISVNGAGSLLKAEDCVFRDGGRITFNGTTPDTSSTVERCLFFDHVTTNHSFLIRLRNNTVLTVSNCAFWGGFAPFGFDGGSPSIVAESCTWTGCSKLVNDTGGSNGGLLTTNGCRGDRWDGETTLPLGDWNSSATSDAGNPGTNSETSVSDATYLTNVAGNGNDSTGTVDLNPAQADGVADANYTPTLTGVDLNGNARTYTATAFGCMDTPAGGGTTSPWYYFAQQQVVAG